MVERENTKKSNPSGDLNSLEVPLDLLFKFKQDGNLSLYDTWMNQEMNFDSPNMQEESFILPSTPPISINSPRSPTVYSERGSFNSPLQFEGTDHFDLNSFYSQDSPTIAINQQPTCSPTKIEELPPDLSLEGLASVWGIPMDIDALKLDQIFQVDQSDLAQSPTLAELNANKDPFFDLEFGYEFVMQERDQEIRVVQLNPKNLQPESSASICPESSTSLVSVEVKEEPSDISSTQSQMFYPKEKSIKDQIDSPLPSTSNVKQSFASMIPGSPVIDQIKMENTNRGLTSTSATIRHSMERFNSSVSSFSNDDEGFAEDEDDDDSDEQISSDEDDDGLSQASWSETIKSTNKKLTNATRNKNNKSNNKSKKYFWQYNIQSKGPKVGNRAILPSLKTQDPHVLDVAKDPVFSPECYLEGVKHAGKARRGDGNDLTPCPHKLYNIGKELNSLNMVINDLTPVVEVPYDARPKSRKEKNKLASRACRLKKKAQHEANKLKLYGLQKEHAIISSAIEEVKRNIRQQLKRQKQMENLLNSVQISHTKHNLEKLLEKTDELKVAGQTAEFVNVVLEKMASGNKQGGLEDL